MSSHATKGVVQPFKAGESAIPVETLLAATASDPELQEAICKAGENGGEWPLASAEL